MRFMVMAAERAATIATTIHRTCRNVGQPCLVARAANSAAVRANGKANTECSNLIISRTMRMRLLLIFRSSAPAGTQNPRSKKAVHFLDRALGVKTAPPCLGGGVSFYLP